jgi:trk system potassium uptake protein TrkH
LIEAAGALLLTLRFLADQAPSTALYWGVFHAVSAFNNAGFDLTSASLRPYAGDGLILSVVGGLIILGGLGFPVLADLWRQRAHWARLTLHTRVVLHVTTWALGVSTLLYLAIEWGNPETFGPLPVPAKLLNALFAAITPRTAGFESVPTGAFHSATLLLTMALMFVGASPGGTGGGIKTTTLAMIALTVRRIAKGEGEIQLMGRRFSQALAEKAFTVLAIASAFVLGAFALLLITESHNPVATFEKVLFEAISAFGTVGLTAGLTPTLTVPGRILITLLMFVGRVGPLTLVVALANRARKAPISYPEDRVMIG